MAPSKNNWRDVKVPPGTVFTSINSNFRKRASTMPSFLGATSLLIGSDYSGASQEEPFAVYSFLITTDAAWAAWEGKRLELRQRLLPDNRRMSYKKLGDKYRRQFLRPILEAADDLHGASISLAFNKTAPSVFPASGPLDLTNPDFAAFCQWRPEVLNKAFTILHVLGILLAGTAHPRQNVFWFTDQDEIAANPTMLTALTKAFGWISSTYLDLDLGHIRCGTTSCDNGSCQIEDFVSIPDLIAGGLSEQFRSSVSLDVRADKILFLSGAGMKDKAQEIMFWFGTRQKNLKKHVFVIDPTEDSKSHKVSWFNFTHEEDGSDH